MARVLQEGQVLNHWIEGRFSKNKNILIATTGPTGSSKTYTSLRMCELWYEYKFKSKFPVATHVCFSIGALMRLLSSGKLKRGELVILEEAGTSINALDYQNRVSKVFSFVLQSFRSMNVGVIFTLPVLTMLNKSARLLLHAHLITCGIDFFTETAKIKPLLHQLNQERGKSYWKYPRMKVNGEMVTIERLNYQIPTKDTRVIYEAMKKKFVYDLAEDFSKELDKIEGEQQKKMSRENLSPVELEVFEDVIEMGLTPNQCAQKRGRSKNGTYDALQRIKDKGFPIEKWIRYRELKSPKKVKAEIAKIPT